MALNSNFYYQSSDLTVGTASTYNWMYYYSYDYSNGWGQYTAGADYDYYRVYLESGVYEAKTSNPYTSSSSYYWYNDYALDNSVTVYDANGNQLAYDNIDGYSTAKFTASSDGYYYIRVQNDDSASYDYGYYNIVVNSTNSAPTQSGSLKTLDGILIDSGKTSGSLTMTTAQLLQGFTDADNDALSVSNVKVASGTGTLASVTGGYKLTSSAEGTVTLTYDVTDGKSTVSATNYVSVVKAADAEIIQTVLDSKTGEDAAEGQLKVYLAAKPTGSQSDVDYYVKLTYKVQDTTEGKFVLQDGSLSDTVQVTLNKDNWSSGVVLKIQGIQDYDNDGDKTYAVKQTAATTNSQNYTQLVRDIAAGGDSFSFINEGDKDKNGVDLDKPLYLVGDDGKPTEDTLVGNDGADRLYGGYMIDDLDGGRGNDRLYGSYEDDFLYGNAGDDQLYGEQDDDFLYGGDGNDRLDGGIGADTLEGGAGNDVYFVSLGDDGTVEDTVTEAANAGKDTIYIPFQVESYVAPTNVEVIRMNAGFSDTTVTGNSANNEIYGNAGDNVVDGGAGNDVLDTGSGNDTLIAGAGNDTLTGGKGSDELTGGTGKDVFDFNALTDSTTSTTTCDVITDFATGDKIDLSGLDANTGVAGDQSFRLNLTSKSNVFGSGAGNTSIGEVRFINDYLYINNDADSSADMVLKVVGQDVTSATTYLVL